MMKPLLFVLRMEQNLLPLTKSLKPKSKAPNGVDMVGRLPVWLYTLHSRQRGRLFSMNPKKSDAQPVVILV
jgi:hypothetical protein